MGLALISQLLEVKRAKAWTAPAYTVRGTLMPVDEEGIGRWWVEGYDVGLGGGAESGPQNSPRYRSSIGALLLSVEEHFLAAAETYEEWGDPHRDIPPSEDEYGRVTRPNRFRIVAARALAWERALSGYGGAIVRHPKGDLEWIVEPRFKIDRASVIYPLQSGALPLIFGYSASSSELDSDTCAVGAGSPPVLLGIIPDCACDACDSGSENLIATLDKWVLSVVNGSLLVEASGGVLKLSTEFGSEESDADEAIGDWVEVKAAAWDQR